MSTRSCPICGGRIVWIDGHLCCVRDKSGPHSRATDFGAAPRGADSATPGAVSGLGSGRHRDSAPPRNRRTR